MRFDHGEVGGSILPVDPQLDINHHFLQPVVFMIESTVELPV